MTSLTYINLLFLFFSQVNGRWQLGLTVCIIWTGSDVFLSTTSIMHLCAIAVHRFLGISYPLRMRSSQDTRHVILLLLPTWGLAVAISLPLVIKAMMNDQHVLHDTVTSGMLCGIFDKTFTIYSSMVSFFIPLTIMVFADFRSVHVLRRNVCFPPQPKLTHSFSNGGSKSPTSKASSLYELTPSEPGSRLHSPCADYKPGSRLHSPCGEYKTSSFMTRDGLTRESLTRESLIRESDGIDMDSIVRDSLAREGLTRDGFDRDTLTRENIMRDNIPREYHTRSSLCSVSDGSRRQSNNHHSGLRFLPPPPPPPLPTSHTITRSRSPLPLQAPRHDRTIASHSHTITRSRSKSFSYIGMLAGRGIVKINSRERRAEKTLIWVFVCFVVLWLPFFCTNLTYGVCKSCEIPGDLFLAFTWLGWISSGVNPCIYTLLNKDFRRAFKNILMCRRSELARKLTR